MVKNKAFVDSSARSKYWLYKRDGEWRLNWPSNHPSGEPQKRFSEFSEAQVYLWMQLSLDKLLGL